MVDVASTLVLRRPTELPSLLEALGSVLRATECLLQESGRSMFPGLVHIHNRLRDELDHMACMLDGGRHISEA